MLIRESVTEYKHIDLGNIKLAFAIVCRDELFKDVYFSANSLYYVESGSAVIYCENSVVKVNQGEIALIKQHSKIDIQKYKDEKLNRDFRSVIFYLFLDFIFDFFKRSQYHKKPSQSPTVNVIRFGKTKHLRVFSESLLPLFIEQKAGRAGLQAKTFEALSLLLAQDKKIAAFLLANARPVKIDLYEFMLNNILSNYSANTCFSALGRLSFSGT